jgi:ribosomal protein L2
LVNTKPFLVNDTAQVLRIEYNPAQSAFVALLRFLKGGFISYSPVSGGTQVGDLIYINPPFKKISSTGSVVLNSNKRADVVAPLYKFPKGAVLSNISARPFGGFALCRSAGVRAKIIAFSSNKKIVELLMPSGKVVYLSSTCFAMSGSNSNPGHFLLKKLKLDRVILKGLGRLYVGLQ